MQDVYKISLKRYTGEQGGAQKNDRSTSHKNRNQVEETSTSQIGDCFEYQNNQVLSVLKTIAGGE